MAAEGQTIGPNRKHQMLEECRLIIVKAVDDLYSQEGGLLLDLERVIDVAKLFININDGWCLRNHQTIRLQIH